MLYTKVRLIMQNFVNVRNEHLNSHGYLFGGIMLKWIDEFAWMAASKDYTGLTMVTVAMDNVIFKHRVVNGAILRFEILPSKISNKSVTYSAAVFADSPGETDEIEVFATNITFVALGENGKAVVLPKLERFYSEE